MLAYPPRSLGEPGNKRVVGRWQLAIVGVLDGQPISNNIDGRFDGQESLAHKKAHIIMGLSDLCGGGTGIRTLDRLQTYAGFQDRCIQPLCHPSAAKFTEFVGQC